MYPSYDDIYNNIMQMFAGVSVWVFIVIGCVLSFLSLLIFVSSLLKAYALYKLSKECKRPYPGLAWVGLFVGIVQSYVVLDIASPKEFKIANIYTFKNRINAFWTLLIINLCSGTISGLLSVLSGIPIIGFIFSLLSMVITIAMAVFAYFYAYTVLKDILEIYKPGCESNTMIAILSLFIPFMQTIVLLTLLKYEPTLSE